MSRKVLVAVDGSDNSEKAFNCKYFFEMVNLFRADCIDEHTISFDRGSTGLN